MQKVLFILGHSAGKVKVNPKLPVAFEKTEKQDIVFQNERIKNGDNSILRGSLGGEKLPDLFWGDVGKLTNILLILQTVCRQASFCVLTSGSGRATNWS